jgi:hypothetical protein
MGSFAKLAIKVAAVGSKVRKPLAISAILGIPYFF